jgi:hypothetical protein
MEICTFTGCAEQVSKPGFKLCLKHWKEAHPKTKGEKGSDAAKLPPPGPLLSATTIGEKNDLTARKINLILAELGWISRDKKGWVPTKQGLLLNAVQREDSKSGIPYVMWPDTILGNKPLLDSIRETKGEVEEIPPEKKPKNPHFREFREKFPATNRTTDGHWVRSKSEMLIDNWLYMNGIAHAFERKLPIEEDVYCDFYIPEGKVYIEYWGLEDEPKYVERKKVKLELYQKYHFNLIELTEDHVKNLDDHLPKMLLKFNVIVS